MSFAATSTNDDPFTMIHRAIVQTLLGTPELMELVKPGNFLLHLDRSIVAKPSATEADLPEIEILPGDLDTSGSPSDGNHYTQQYAVQVSTSELNAEPIHRIKFALLKAFNRLRRDNMGLDRKPVISVRLIRAASAVSEEPGRRIGWTLTAAIEIKLVIADWEVGL